MESFDYYDISPAGYDAYRSHHGHHFSKPMLEWAVSMMEDRYGDKVKVIEKQDFEDRMKVYNQIISRKVGYYDGQYVWCMGTADYLGDSVPDEHHLAKFVKNYLDDRDGNPTKAFDEFVTNCYRKGIDIPWKDMI